MNARKAQKATTALLTVGLFLSLGCYHTPVDITAEGQGPAPLRMPSPSEEAQGNGNYEHSLTGGQVFSMYCGYCHFPRSLAERPFANYRTAAAHMRVVADLTGEEHAKLLEFLRRFHDVPPPNPPVEPSPKRFFFSQPIAELRPQAPPGGAAPTPRAEEPLPLGDSSVPASQP